MTLFPLHKHSIHTHPSIIMQSIIQSYNSNPASNPTNFSSCSSPMSIFSFISSIASNHPDSPTLPCLKPLSPVPSARTFGSPTPKRLTFSTAKYIESICLCPVKVKDTDSEDESLSLLLPTNFTAQCSAKVPIKVEHFESVHNTWEAEAKQLPPFPNTNANTASTTIPAPLTEAKAATALLAISTTTLLHNSAPHQSHCSRQID